MKVSIDWLKDYVQFEGLPSELIRHPAHAWVGG